ncbi:hypothetical protein ACOJUR_14840 [Alicyclobacillus tolerans]|uniref:hypothetical protein n=1 Tax=Alicyclobacillus tolerans TaxID=90970 RepID=UPI003B7F956A
MKHHQSIKHKSHHTKSERRITSKPVKPASSSISVDAEPCFLPLMLLPLFSGGLRRWSGNRGWMNFGGMGGWGNGQNPASNQPSTPNSGWQDGGFGGIWSPFAWQKSMGMGGFPFFNGQNPPNRPMNGGFGGFPFSF